MMHIRRALLFMPGDDRHKIEKGAVLGVDSVIMDLEDGVALNHKDAARETVRAALQEVDFGKTERLVRINPVGSVFHADDLAATIDGHPDGYVLPKVQSLAQIEDADDWLAAAERARGWPENDIALLAIIETALGIINLREIAASSPRLQALIFGAEDLAGDIGAIRTSESMEVFYARSAVVLHAKAFGLQAIDSPYVQLGDGAKLESVDGASIDSMDGANIVRETRRALEMGYTGKLAIHPKQVAPIQQVFTPTAGEIERAQALISAHAAHQSAGTGVFAYEGKMIDMPMIRAAETVLARAKAAGLLNDE